MMKSSHRGSALAGLGVLERPRYYPRQLITPADMTLEQRYFRDRLRRHNRLLHGWGVVCGAQVCRVSAGADAEPWMVRVTPGYILGPHGDEILVEKTATIDLRTLDPREPEACGSTPPLDPWCAPVRIEPDASPAYLAIRFEESPSRPVRTQPAGCGCGDTGCEYSRWNDGYRFGLLRACPTSHLDPPVMEDLMKGLSPECPECPPDPWVVLARIEFDSGGVITLIDNCSCRRMAVSFARAWWQCQTATMEAEAEPTTALPGQAGVSLVVTGKGLSGVSGATLGSGVSIRHVNVVSPERIEILCDIAATAAGGPRTLRLVTGCAGTIEVAAALIIDRPDERHQPEERSEPAGGRERRPRKRDGGEDRSSR